MKNCVIIYNRAGAIATDGWIHIVPKGELPNPEAGIVQVLDDQSLDAMMASIAADRQKLGDNWPGIYAGREHFIYDADKDSAALAWFKDFEKRDNGIWAKEEGLTPAGQAAVKNREYKFTSFCADPSDLKRIDGNRYRVMKLETVGFTNQANGKNLLTPITNRETFAGAEATAANQHQNHQAKPMKNVALKLGLAAEASEESVLEAVTKIMNRSSALDASVTELRGRITPLETENQTLLGEQVDALLESHGVKEPKVVNRLKPVLLTLKNRQERIDTLGDFGFKPVAAGAQTRIINRGQGGTGATAEKAPDEKAEQLRSQKVMNRAQVLVKEIPGLSLATAVTMANREVIE